MTLIDIHPIYQTVTSWSSVARGVKGVWVKGAEGAEPYRKKPADSHVKGAKSVGLDTGLYGWAYGNVSPESQAEALVEEAERLGATDLRPAWDVEDATQFYPNTTAGRDKIRDWSERWAKRVIKLGHRPAVYLPGSWAKVVRPELFDVPDLCIWIARYGANNGGLSAEPDDGGMYSGRWDVHQYTSRGRVTGIDGYVDLNRTKTDRYLNNKAQEWDEMATKAEFAEVLEENQLLKSTFAQATDAKWAAIGAQKAVAANSAALGALAKLVADQGGKALTEARVKAVVEAAVVDAVIDVDITVRDDVDEQPAAA